MRSETDSDQPRPFKPIIANNVALYTRENPDGTVEYGTMVPAQDGAPIPPGYELVEVTEDTTTGDVTAVSIYSPEDTDGC